MGTMGQGGSHHASSGPPLVGTRQRRRRAVSRRGRRVHRQRRDPLDPRRPARRRGRNPGGRRRLPDRLCRPVITGGRLGGIVGRKRVFIAGVLGFTLASLWCGLSGSPAMLIFARAAQGGAAAIMVPQVLASIHTLFPDAARTRAFTICAVAIGLGAAVGFMAGGWLVPLNLAGLGWRSIFCVDV